jgi:hypothetical protein
MSTKYEVHRINEIHVSVIIFLCNSRIYKNVSIKSFKIYILIRFVFYILYQIFVWRATFKAYYEVPFGFHVKGLYLTTTNQNYTLPTTWLTGIYEKVGSKSVE